MADPAVDLWASDEVHFQQHGSRCRMWIPPETKDPVLLHARGAAWDTLGRCGCATAGSTIAERRTSCV